MQAAIAPSIEMPEPLKISEPTPMQLAALIASKVCHDIISPVGAIANGLEMMEMEKDADMRAFALDLVKQSSVTAAAKLKFARVAYGAGGSTGASIDTGNAKEVAEGYMALEKPDFVWNGPRLIAPKNRVKLLLNVVYLSTHAVPRGGQVSVAVQGPQEVMGFTVRCSGRRAHVPADLTKLMEGGLEGEVTVPQVQPLYTLLLAREEGMTFTAEMDGEDVVFTAR